MKKCCILKLDRYLDRYIYRDSKYEAPQISLTAVSLETYENQFFRSNFTYIHMYVFRLSSFTTLNIYKNYFKGCHNVVADVVESILWLEIILSSSSFFLKKLLRLYVVVFYNQGVSRSSSCGWIEKLCSQHLFQVGVLVTYWYPCID